MMYYKQNQKSGFSLVETLVAIAILLLVIVGPMAIATNAANSTNFANQQITAYFLAQEGLELAQKGRDDYLLASLQAGNAEGSNLGWNAYTSNGGPFAECFTNGCGLEIVENAAGTIDVTNCANVTNCSLYFQADTAVRARYTHDSSGGAEITDFTRVITMEEISPDKDVLVTAVVSWRAGNQIAVQSTTATTYLYNIYGR